MRVQCCASVNTVYSKEAVLQIHAKNRLPRRRADREATRCSAYEEKHDTEAGAALAKRSSWKLWCFGIP